ncbi:MAG: hypothetical protein WKF83_03995 [Nocardioidaceae bacterium]
MSMCAPTVAALAAGFVEVGADRALEGGQAVVLQASRWHVDLDVELTELGLEVLVGDRLKGLGVLQGRIAVLVDQVELDLDARHRSVDLERFRAEHPGEDVQAGADLRHGSWSCPRG